ncbi:MAG TPA: S-layer homology domain-containing protein, partial [Candidatus Saccharimonadales bacterium]|nr:S-layer homology domain-containing protein [Candidatus Saccharimonadales bacterium]
TPGGLAQARAWLERAAALGDTLAPRWAAALVPPAPPTPAESLLAAAQESPALTRLQWAALLQRYGAPARAPRLPAPDLEHFHAVRDSLFDVAGSPWVSLAREAVLAGHLELFPDGSFRGEDTVTRGRFALWLDLYEWPVAAGADPVDLDPKDYRRGAVERALGAGLLGLRPGGRFEADAPITGSEAAQALRRAAEAR